ncbi:putative F-box/kelch-repeat protein At1g12870 [Prosopis cineraria]|uniref:putative F-box/kelch-repeat protein At1g12870 n=1 Tax=Prosopis cineraria TaxID=364024 RepID=UPI0024102475|nr:putative F-box/kelch-repeat protein At1g12870 [Prosopis cineraria]
MKMDSDASFLPEEIVLNILKRLPVKSLIRFQSVCKHWKNVINSRYFVADHLHYSSLQNPCLLFQQSSMSVRLLDCGLQLQDREFQNALLINSLKGATTGIVGSCNGVLCVEIHRCNVSPPSLLLWNPANREFRHVPRTRKYIDSDDCMVGFGYSPIVDDYKIVRTYSEFDDSVNRVEVFSLRRGSWRGINIGNLKGVKLHSETVTANGAIFWSGLKLGLDKDEYDIEEHEDDIEESEDDIREGEGDTEVIVSFDIAKEVFTLMPRPDLDHNAEEKLAVYQDRLAILFDIWEDDGHDNDDGMSSLIELWVMEKGPNAFGEGWNWTKLYTGSPSSLYPMAIWRNEIVCKSSSEEDEDEGRNDLYLLNISTNETKGFDIPRWVDAHSTYNYAESLVSICNFR